MADKLLKTAVQITLDSRQFVEGMSAVQRAASFEQTLESVKGLSDRSQGARDKLKALTDSLVGVEQGRREFKALSAEIRRTENDIGGLSAQLKQARQAIGAMREFAGGQGIAGSNNQILASLKAQGEAEQARATLGIRAHRSLREEIEQVKAAYPPNGWYCHCKVVAESARSLARKGLTVSAHAPNDGVEQRLVGVRSGNPQVVTVPKGIDPGWDYAPGALRANQVRAALSRRADLLPQPLQGDLLNTLGDVPPARLRSVPVSVEPARRAEALGYVAEALANRAVKQPVMVMAPLSASAVQGLAAMGIEAGTRRLALSHDGVLHALKQHGDAATEVLRGQEPVTAEDLALFGQLFNSARLTPGAPAVVNGVQRVEGEVTFGGYRYRFAAGVQKFWIVPITLFKRRLK